MKTYRFFFRFFLSLLFFFSFFMILSTPRLHAKDGDFVWANGMGQNLDDKGYAIIADSSGNVYTTGYFQGDVDFDPGAGITTLSSAGNNDIFISKLNSAGALVWARSFGSTFDDEGWEIFVDSAGNVYTTGYFQDTVDFDPGAGIFNLNSAGSSDIFISKLDSNGNFLGAWAMGGTASDYGYGIFVDASGNIYTTGYFQNSVDFDPAPGGIFNLTSIGVEDVFISKLDNSGNFLWAKTIGGGASDVGLGISLYSSGNIYISGWFQGTVDFDPGTGVFDLISNSGSNDIYVSKLDSNGNFVWAKAMGGPSDDIGQAVSVDSLDNVYTTGWFNGTVDFDPGPGIFDVPNSGQFGADIFISKLDSNGDFVWAKSMGGTSSDGGYGISVDTSGNVYTTGFFGGTVDFNPSAEVFDLVSSGGADIFISKLNSGGNFVWAKAMGDTSDDYGYDISVDSSGNVLTTGSYKGTVDFDPGDPGTSFQSSAGFEDIFISKLSGSDNFPWAMFLPAIIKPPVL